MQSNFARYLDDGAARPPIQGIDLDGRLARDASPAPTRVPELVLHISQQEWRHSGPTGAAVAAGPGLSASSFSWSDDAGMASRSAGLRGQSQLQQRSGAAR